jgi:hypothetical protein
MAGNEVGMILQFLEITLKMPELFFKTTPQKRAASIRLALLRRRRRTRPLDANMIIADTDGSGTADKIILSKLTNPPAVCMVSVLKV